tara:strand:+ start:809 stop:1012 length:204 start_codon:yes stop_codon:yes gene_type:complete
MKIISIEITESPLILPNAGVIHTLSGKKIYRSVKLLEKEVPNGRKKKISSESPHKFHSGHLYASRSI